MIDADDNFFNALGLPATGSELLTIDVQRRSKRFTADQIKKNEAKVDAVLEAVGLGIPQKMIAQAFGVSDHTVRELIKQHPNKVALNKKKLADKMLLVADRSVDNLLDIVSQEGGFGPKVLPSQVAVMVGILTEKAQLLNGEATAILGTAGEVTSYDRLQERMAQIRRLAQRDAITVEPEDMGCEVEAEKQKGAGAGEAIEGGDSGCVSGAVDGQSTAADPQNVGGQQVSE